LFLGFRVNAEKPSVKLVRASKSADWPSASIGLLFPVNT
jgi:hypothetical protein